MIMGIDEVGRGPWAGPLVVGAVVLGGTTIDGLDDSKKLTKKRREVLDIVIREKATGFGLGWVSASELDEIGLSESLRLATRRAVEQVHVPYHEIIIDGTINFLSGTSKGEFVTTLPKADALVPSVSAASIIAKVARDRYMAEQDAIYPGYGFAAHVGYGVVRHREAIEQLGVTPLHRLSFAPLQKYRVSPLPSSQIPDESARRSLSAGPVTSSAPKNFSGKLKEFLGTTPRSATHASASEIGLMPPTTRAIGNASEEEAANYLVRHGHEIIERNWRTRWCEIDIVSKNGTTLYFTEVKHRKSAKQGDGFAAITETKQRQMTLSARMYVHIHEEAKRYDLRLAAVATSGEPPIVEDYLELE